MNDKIILSCNFIFRSSMCMFLGFGRYKAIVKLRVISQVLLTLVKFKTSGDKVLIRHLMYLIDNPEAKNRKGNGKGNLVFGLWAMGSRLGHYISCSLSTSNKFSISIAGDNKIYVSFSSYLNLTFVFYRFLLHKNYNSDFY